VYTDIGKTTREIVVEKEDVVEKADSEAYWVE
jgi:hypothetical protein